MKKIICLLLSVMFIFLIVVPVLAGDLQSGDYTYTVNADGETATITGYVGTAEILVIPSKLDGYTITAIGDRAFFGTRKLDSVTIPGTVKTIGESAFEDCSALRTIDLEEGVTTIGARAFYCSFAKWVYIPHSLKSIGADAFYMDDIYTISRVRYNGTKSEWGKIEIEGGNWLLTSCEQHVLIAEENSDYSYYQDNRAYENDYYRSWVISSYRGTEKNVVLPETLDGHKLSAVGGFFGNKFVETVTIPACYSRVTGYAFGDCINLKTVKIEGATTISSNAFKGCTSLKTVYLPKCLESIYYSAFENCNSLKNVYFTGSKKEWSEVKIYGNNEPLTKCKIQYIFDFENEEVVLKSTKNTIKGILISWEKFPKAEKYIVYRKTERDTKWTRLNTTTATSYEDTKVSPNIQYKYTVRAQSGSKYSSFDSSGLSQIFMTAPKISTLKNAKNGVFLKWNNINGARYYNIYRKTTGGWAKIASTTAVSYIDENVSNNVTYTYTVTACMADTSSWYYSGTKNTFLSTPKINTAKNRTSGAYISWNKISGATKYYVYRKTTGDWSRIGETKSTSFTDKKAKNNVKYIYTVRAIKNNVASSFESGTALVYMSAPKISTIKNAKSGVFLEWNKIKGAKTYNVYRKTTDGWVRIATVSNTSFTDKTAKKGVTYTYTVRAFNGNNSSSYYSGKTIKHR